MNFLNKFTVSEHDGATVRAHRRVGVHIPIKYFFFSSHIILYRNSVGKGERGGGGAGRHACAS